jgi:hypothetical protein
MQTVHNNGNNISLQQQYLLSAKGLGVGGIARATLPKWFWA